MSEFRQLHERGLLLLLPNAWDAGSARLIESLGAKAIATTSAGVAWARGYNDGNPCITEPAEIEAVAKAVPMPLNVMWMPGLPPLSELERLGVRRLSAGAAIAAIALGTIASSSSAFLENGTLASGEAMLYGEIASLFA